MFRIVAFASGSGGNFQSLIDNQKKFNYSVFMLITDRVCGAVEKAYKNKIDCYVFEKQKLNGDMFMRIDEKLGDVDLIVLAGFFPIVPSWFCEKWKRKIINTHPSLLPKYGGKGMHGVKVHEAVMRNCEKYTGCTVHFVNEFIDGGEIIAQKKIKVNYLLTPWELGEKVFEEEIKLLPQIVGQFVVGKVK